MGQILFLNFVLYVLGSFFDLGLDLFAGCDTMRLYAALTVTTRLKKSLRVKKMQIKLPKVMIEESPQKTKPILLRNS
jgi:hypothetical protein